MGLMRVFIPARLSDNPYLHADGQYRAFLVGLPDGLREAWRDGSWDDPIIRGAYYTAELLKATREARIKLVPHDPELKVHTVWDLGIDDAMCIAFVQKTSQEVRVIDYYQNEGFGFQHYAAKLQELQAANGYVYGHHFAPHDANQREKQTGKTLVQFAETLGIKLDVVPSIPVQDGIQRVRLLFPRLWISETKCEQFLSGVRNYRKQWDENILLYKPEPVHDWASHPGDVLRYLALVEDQMDNADLDRVAAARARENRDARRNVARDVGVS